MIVIPDEGKIEWHKRALYGPSNDNLSLRLFKNNITPADTDTVATYTVADFTGYANVVLTSGNAGGQWATPTISGGIATSSYGTIAVWTAGSNQTVYGWYMVFVTANKVAGAQVFSAPRALDGANADQITIPPRLQLNDF